MQAILQRDIYKMFYIKEGMHYQQDVENELQNIIKYFVFLGFKELILETLNYILHYASEALLLRFIKFYGKSYVILKTCS
jgi:hypothetical protein